MKLQLMIIFIYIFIQLFIVLDLSMNDFAFTIILHYLISH
jgi:hypothetical protein